MRFKFVPIKNKNKFDIGLSLLDFKNRITWFIQLDLNIWWFPKHIYKRREDGLYCSWGWLFLQFGFFKHFE